METGGRAEPFLLHDPSPVLSSLWPRVSLRINPDVFFDHHYGI
jgi:hypothetical protein